MKRQKEKESQLIEVLDHVEIQKTIQSLEKDILQLLERMVAINSYSQNHQGIRQVLEVAREAMPSLLTENEPPKDPNTLIWTFENTEEGQPPIIAVGHLDTVFPPGMFDDPMEERGAYIHGPGVADMKGGVVVLIGALWVLERLGLLPHIPLLVALNGDEEIGSRSSAPVFRQLAGRGRLGLVFECGGKEGQVVTSRRGIRKYQLTIDGPAGHAGFQTGQKQSALVELAHQILRLENLNNPKEGISVNVGVARGGTAVNVVPSHAEAEMELRFWDEEMGNSAADRIMASLASPKLPKVHLNLNRTHARPAMAKTPEIDLLFRSMAALAERIGVNLKDEARLGASDGNLLTSAGLPTVDGLGPVGMDDHSNQERIIKETIFQRVQLTAHLLWGLRKWQVDPA